MPPNGTLATHDVDCFVAGASWWETAQTT